jgi:hypothetical protein
MIDKIDGIKFLRKTADFIENCNKEKCVECLLYDRCRILVERTVDFIARSQKNTEVILIP